MNTEQQIKDLENAIKALKASQPVAASKIQTSVQASQEFEVTGNPAPRFKFTPHTGAGKNIFVTLRAMVTIGGQPAGFSPFVNEPQDGSGNVIIKVQFDNYYSSTVYTVKIFSVGTNSGSFSML